MILWKTDKGQVVNGRDGGAFMLLEDEVRLVIDKVLYWLDLRRNRLFRKASRARYASIEPRKILFIRSAVFLGVQDG